VVGVVDSRGELGSWKAKSVKRNKDRRFCILVGGLVWV